MTTSLKTTALLVVLCCLAASALFAQPQDCKPFVGVLQGKLDVSPTGQGWTSHVRTLLGNSEPLFGPMTYNSASGTQHGVTGHDSQVVFSIDFGPNGVLVTKADKGIFPLNPKVGDPVAIGDYMATAKVDPVASTGRFSNATGGFTFNGPFLVDGKSAILNGENDLTDIGAWNSEIRGRLCGVR